MVKDCWNQPFHVGLHPAATSHGFASLTAFGRICYRYLHALEFHVCKCGQFQNRFFLGGVILAQWNYTPLLLQGHAVGCTDQQIFLAGLPRCGPGILACALEPQWLLAPNREGPFRVRLTGIISHRLKAFKVGVCSRLCICSRLVSCLFA